MIRMICAHRIFFVGLALVLAFRRISAGCLVTPDSNGHVTISNGSVFPSIVPFQAFMECDSLVSVVIGDNIVVVGGLAFLRCPNLVSVVIGDDAKGTKVIKSAPSPVQYDMLPYGIQVPFEPRPHCLM